MISNSNSNNNNRFQNLNAFSNLYSNLKKRKVNPLNARKDENNAIRENFERSLGLSPGLQNYRQNPSKISIKGRNYSNYENFFNAIINNKNNARKRLYKMIYA